MIKFFRNIRKQFIIEGKAISYIKYALGEIVLVVIGILIALQFNNYNQSINQEKKIKEYANLYIQDLEADILMTQINWSHIDNVSRNIDSLANAVRNKEIDQIANIDFLSLTWNILYRPYRWNRTTMEQMTNSGSLQYIKDISISKKIREYDAFTYHLDEDFLNDKAKSEEALSLISEVVNSNYSNLNTLRSDVLVRVNNPEIKDFHLFTNPLYLEAKKENLKLITTDKRDVIKVINSLSRLQGYYDIRSNIELPQITKQAKELIDLLKDIYTNE